MTPKLYFKVFPDPQKKLWTTLTAKAVLLNRLGYYLAGGTALALQLGHRQSLDFDFFSQKKGSLRGLCDGLEKQARFVIREMDSDTLHAEIENVKVSFIGGYKYPLLKKPIDGGGVKLASLLDIALMKLLAICHRATLRDYIDLAVILRHQVGLPDLLRAAPRKYGKGFNRMIPLRALVAFDDIEQDEEKPRLFDKTIESSWQSILSEAVQRELK